MGKRVCEIVAERVLEELKKGEIPWQKPWFGCDRYVSHASGKHYSLLNCILLGQPGEYITYDQARAEGGNVKKGTEGKMVVYWKITKKQATDKNGVPVTDEDGEPVMKTVPILRYYKVFNVNDCENIKKKYLNDDDTRCIHEKDMGAEEIIDRYMAANEGLRLFREEKSNRAFYRPSEDFIQVPNMEQFEKLEEFYSTLFHEMTHSTGHWTRLGRFKEDEKLAAFGSEDYSKEELIAELGAAALCGKCGIESESSFRNSAAYIQGWMEAIKNDPNLLVSAAGKADKAVEFILGEEEAA